MNFKGEIKQLMDGNKWYFQNARDALPYLVKQAKQKRLVSYTELVENTSISHPRNVSYPLGAIGYALKELEGKKGKNIPQIQCIAVSEVTNLPGDGIGEFINVDNYKELTKSEKQQRVKQEQDKIYNFREWDWVLQELQLSPPND